MLTPPARSTSFPLLFEGETVAAFRDTGHLAYRGDAVAVTLMLFH